MKIVYLSKTWLRLYFKSITKKLSIFLNIFNLEKIKKIVPIFTTFILVTSGIKQNITLNYILYIYYLAYSLKC